MTKYLLLVASLLLSFQSSYSRPQTFFSRTQQGFSRFNQQAARRPTVAFKGAFLSVPSSGSGDIIEQARTQADTLKDTLRSLARKPEAKPILEKVFAGKNSDCINSMDQAIEAIETSTKLLENAGTEMKLLIETVKIFQNVTEISKAVRASGKIIRILEVLIPKLTPSTSACKTNSADVFESMRSLGSLVDELSSKDDLYYSAQVRQSLKSASKILSTATKFLKKESHFKFDHFCTKNKDYNKEFFTAIGNMMSDLAVLYTDLGGEIAAEELRKQEDFTKKVVDTIDKIGEVDLIRLDCNTPDSTNLVANTMEELAGIIDDIGIENLCNQLDLDSSVCTFPQ